MSAGAGTADSDGEASGLVVSLHTTAGPEDFAVPVQSDFAPRGRAEGGRSRAFFAAPHVVATRSDAGVVVDWDRTIAFREHLWDQGLGVAEVMDTAQRGMGLTWPDVGRLIELTSGAARGRPLACGIGTDQLAPDAAPSTDEIVRSYLEQAEVVGGGGGVPVVMASRHLVRAAASVDDYLGVYERVLAGIDGPVILHWLGEVFDAALRGYWGTSDVDAALDTLGGFIGAHAAQVDGVKVSLLDARYELRLRAALPEGVRMYTGDDYNFAELIAGDGAHHSDALLGAFNPLAPLAGAALDLFDDGRQEDARALLASAVPLSTRVFEPPTQYYKTGMVFLAWLNGHQDDFLMLGGMETARDVEHLSEVFRLAARAGVLADVELACHRMRSLLADSGVRS